MKVNNRKIRKAKQRKNYALATWYTLRAYTRYIARLNKLYYQGNLFLDFS